VWRCFEHRLTTHSVADTVMKTNSSEPSVINAAMERNQLYGCPPLVDQQAPPRSARRFFFQKYFTESSTNLNTCFARSPSGRRKKTAIMSSPAPEPEKEDELKARLQHSKDSVTQFQMSVEALKDEAKHAQSLLETKLSKVSRVKARTYPSKGHDSDLKYLANDVTPVPVKIKLEELRTRCSMLLLQAKSLVDAKKIDGIIAEVEFDIFTPPHGITEWAHWTSHRIQTRQDHFSDLEEAVAWWEKQRETWKGIQATVSETRDALRRDLKSMEEIQKIFASSSTKQVRPKLFNQ